MITRDEQGPAAAGDEDSVPLDGSGSARPGPWCQVSSGDVLAQRFVVECVAGSGGMGTIYRARDLRSDTPVAIKTMATETGQAGRFAREVAVLADLVHPSIVRYIAHGATERGIPFLVMEWLHGEDLSMRLARLPLSVDESLALARGVCDGLAFAHARGVVHRDVKPSNLFLIDGDPSKPKLLDFGIARRNEGIQMTNSGTILGTLGYMAPEQAMGPGNVDPRADVFALGCVLFECLTGQAAFRGPNPVAVLAKVLRHEPPPIGELRQGLDKRLERLVARMVSKNPADRPMDAAATRGELDLLEGTLVSPTFAPATAVTLTAREQRIISVILARPRSNTSELDVEPRLEPELIRAVTEGFGADLVPMRGGRLMVVLGGRGAATDQARQAAECALLLGQARTELSLAVATGTAEAGGPVPVGAAIDRAAELLSRNETGGDGGVAVDELTAGLLDPSLEVQRRAGTFVLTGRRPETGGGRLLMGKPTPFVGRDREQTLLDLTLRECIDESVARAVLVTGPPGQGKSRLRQEFTTKALERGNIRTFCVRADPMSAGSSHRLARQIVRQTVGLRESEPAATQQAFLRARIERICRPGSAARVAGFLAELLGAPSFDDPSPELRAARNDPRIMNLWLGRAFIEWLEGECAERPLLLMLEDLHWGDVPSMHLVGEALRLLSTRPLMVLGLARPEIHEKVPNLWSGTGKIDVPLARLTARAGERLVREVLSDQLPSDAVRELVERADGNAFYLEELIRRAALGDQTTPETVLALVQSRLERLDADARRIVRAASIFGEVCWQGAVAALLGPTTDPGSVRAAWQSLVVGEVVVDVSDSRFANEREFRFRHAMLRDAAYSMLTDDDRLAGHGLAGEWLENAGETDALTLTNHFERSGMTLRAIPWLRRAAAVALAANAYDDVLALAGRPIAAQSSGTERGLLRVSEASALMMQGRWRACAEALRESLELLPAGGVPWFQAVSGLLLAAASLGDESIAAFALSTCFGSDVQPEASGPYGIALFSACQGLVQSGNVDVARALVHRAEELVTDPRNVDPAFVAWSCIARAHLTVLDGNLGQTLALLSKARSEADRGGAVLGRVTAGVFLVQAFFESGCIERAEEVADETCRTCDDIGASMMATWATLFLGFARTTTGRVSEARAAAEPLLGAADNRVVNAARVLLSRVLLDSGDPEGALREGKAAEQAAALPGFAAALAAQSIAELRLDRPASALALADRGLEVASRACFPYVRSWLRLARAEALHALGRDVEACATINEARDAIIRIAGTLDDPSLRDGYLSRVDANQRTMALAAAWVGESTPPRTSSPT